MGGQDSYEDEIKKLSSEIIKAYGKRKRIMILVGSGISKSGGVPMFSEIMEHLQRNCKDTGEDSDKCKDLLSFRKLNTDDHDQLINSSAWKKTIEWLEDKIKNSKLTRSHEIIADLCFEGYIDYIFSLNYDNLFERACEDKIVTIENPKHLEKFLLDEPKLKPYLIKAHGDFGMMLCRECAHTFPKPDEISRTKKCPNCNKENIIRYILLPDSAKSQGKEFADLLKDRAEFFDLIISIGFSGRHDPHITQMMRYFQDKNVIICNIDPDATNQLINASIVIKQEADKVFPKLKDLILKGKQPLELSLRPAPFFDSIYKFVDLTDIERDVCSNEFFLRLRGIHQLGLKYCKYISANHTRFEHSIGTMNVANEMYLNLKCIDGKGNIRADKRRNSEELQFLRLAALLHDVGHIWFGHLGEEVMEEVWGKGSHEDFFDIIIKKYFKDDITKFFKTYTLEDLIVLVQGKSGIKVLEKIIKSTFDADKIEYLLRDSRMTGKDYGIEIDKDNLFKNLIVDGEGELYINEPAISALERLAEARYHMYKEVYFDSDVRCLESIFKKALIMWIRWRKLDNKEVNDPELIDFLLKEDAEILQLMKNDLDEIKKDINTQDSRIRFLDKVLRIIQGLDPIPSGILYNLYSSSSKEGEFKNIFKEINEFNKDYSFEDFVVIDTQNYIPYRKEEDSCPILSRDKDGKLKKRHLTRLSPFIRGFQDEKYKEYLIRIWFIDESKKSDLLKEINTKLEVYNIEYEIRA